MINTLTRTTSKAEKLKAQINDAKAQLKKLEQTKKLELGALLIKYQLDQLAPEQLDQALAKLSQETLNND